jgi:hypothetical protein
MRTLSPHLVAQCAHLPVRPEHVGIVDVGARQVLEIVVLSNPARSWPICMSHGQTAAGGASMVMARVRYADGSTASPGYTMACSSGVEPQFISQRWKTATNRPHTTANVASSRIASPPKK